MAFSNPVVGSGNSLIRQAIQSPNYVAGTAGWRIAKDGSAELNASTVRGSLRVDGAGSRYIEIAVDSGQPFIEFSDSAGKLWNLSVAQNGGNAEFRIEMAGSVGPTIDLTENFGIYMRADDSAFEGIILDPISRFLVATPPSSFSIETWHNVTFQNGWSDVSAGTGGYERCQYRLMPDGTVMLHGLAAAGTTANGTTIFTLPAGYRPEEDHLIPCATGNATTFATLQVTSTGNCNVFNVGAAGISLSGIRFAVAALT